MANNDRPYLLRWLESHDERALIIVNVARRPFEYYGHSASLEK